MKQCHIQNYDILDILGIGSYSKVRLIRNKKDGKYRCVKIMKKQNIIKLKQVDHVINEGQILNSIYHPFIINFDGIGQTNKLLYFFFEYVGGGQLFTHLRQVGCFEPHVAAFYGAQVTLVFQYLHSKNIIYRDLKPQNILISLDGYIKLIDFGFAKVVENRTFTLCGTPQYLAPQVLLNKGHGKAVDWWTLGVFLFQMLAGIDPFYDQDPMIIYQNILKGQIKFPLNFNNDAKSLVKHLLKADLSARYGNLVNGSYTIIQGILDIKKHRYLNVVNFNNLLNKKISPPFRPNFKSPHDTSNFQKYNDSGSQYWANVPTNNPFVDW